MTRFRSTQSLHAAGITILAGVVLLSGCSFFGNARPDPSAENVFCAIEYRPSVSGSGHDLLFLAWSNPYQMEKFYMSLPDMLVHSVAAPGRHLTKDARVEGATCSAPSWTKGFRLPAAPSSTTWMLCKRNGEASVLFQVETKWGTCSRTIAHGDMTPRDLGALRSTLELPDLPSP